VADDPQRHPEGDDVPEEALRAGPLAAAPEDNRQHQRGRGEQARVAEDRQRERPPSKRPADRDVGQKERQPKRHDPDAGSQDQSFTFIQQEWDTVAWLSALDSGL